MQFIYERYKNNVVINRFVNLLSVDVLVKSSSFLLIPIYLKLFTQPEFGLYNYLLSIVGFFSQILNFGLYVAQSKIYQELEESERGSFLYSLHVLLLALLTGTLCIIYGFGFDRDLISLLFKTSFHYDTYRWPMLLAIISSVYSFIFYNYFLTTERIKIVQRYNVTRLILLNVVVLAVLYFFKNERVSLRLISTYTIESLLIITYSYYLIKEMKAKMNFKLVFRSIKIGFPVMTSAIFGIVMSFGDKFFLEKKAGLVDLSVYYLAFSVANVIPTIFNTLQNIWLPIFLKEKDLNKNLQMTKKMVYTVFGSFVLISIGVIIFIKLALFFNVIDIKYSKVLYVLPVVFLSLSIEATSHLLINYITYFEQTFILPAISIVLGVISITLNIIFIGKYGLYGAAYSSLCISVLSFVSQYFILKYNVKRFRKETVIIN